ncbi:hypothetical protein F8M41_008701 [Gigaspora margarita]|uniref:Uncharacterized protein n=1 Tax=Gigaspora margarita TaxID=4874 RepID=A0A8H4A3K5_GIGMA|nr:hypothetical protein F8M41_008701 [Gigaspora margarita]
MLLSFYSESSDKYRNSLIETEPFQMDTTPLLVEDNAPQNTFDESDFEDHEDASFNTFYKLETVPDLEDYQGASFDDAFDDLHHLQNVK